MLARSRALVFLRSAGGEVDGSEGWRLKGERESSRVKWFGPKVKSARWAGAAGASTGYRAPVAALRAWA